MSLPPFSSSAMNLNNGQRKLRIAVFSRNFSPSGGGAERYAIGLAEQLATRHEIHVFAQEVDHQWPGITYHRISRPLLKPRWINQLWFACCTWWATRHGFDVVHSHENTWHGNVQTVHVLPVAYNLFHGRNGQQRLLRWIKVVTSPRLIAYLALERSRYTVRLGRQVVVTSDSLRTIMAASYPSCSQRLSVITPGITMPELEATPQGKRDAKEMLGLPGIGLCLLFVANDYRKKGLATLLDALAQLPSEIVLAVVGDPGQIHLFSPQINLLKLSKRIFFLGSMKDVGPAYRAADCLVHPTLEDTFAMVVLESMAHGLPVIVSGAKYCGIAGLLQHGVNAVILENPKDTFQLHYEIVRVLTQAGLKNQLSQGAVDFARHHEWRETALMQEALYFTAVGEKIGSSIKSF